jgi:glycosyltransferase involved in cell wall biosynthesis
VRLVERGHEVAVFCDRVPGAHRPACFQGVRLLYSPGIRTKHLLKLTQTAVSVLRALFGRYDIVHVYTLGNATLLPLLALARVPTVISVDGLDWRRTKWGGFASRYIRWCEGVAARFARELVIDSHVVAGHYAEKYGRRGAYVPYGAYTERATDTDVVERFGLEPGRYVLFIGRLTPEKNVHRLIEAFTASDVELKLAIVGDDPYAHDYVEKLKSTRDPRVRFLGYVYGENALQLCSHAYLYATASELEGTSPALLMAMGCGCCPLVNGIPENLETIGEAGVSYAENDVEDLRSRLEELARDPERVRALGEAAGARVAEKYHWDRVTDALEKLYQRATDGG